MNRLMTWPLVCGLLGLGLARTALATGDFAGDTYTNNEVLSYPGTETHPPMIDATNFINNSSFTINFTTLSLVQPFYETSDTLNYTNGDNGVMMANTGFRFDNQSSGTGARTMSGSFYNSGKIWCSSVNDTTDPFGGFLGLLGYAQCLINATNIANPGAVDVGVNGLMQFTGQNVDLSGSTLNVEGAGANVGGSGVFGLNTNYWDPSLFLGPNFAESAPFPIAPGILYLPNSTAYFNVASGASNNIIRAVFIQDNSGSNVSYNVYFRTAGLGFGPGAVTIEWVGQYQDVASGNFFSNYLYLNDDYVAGVQTNVTLINGIPDNFTFTESGTRLPTGVAPAGAGFLNVFPAGSITNLYDYANVQLLSSTVSTNNVANQAITNLPGRIQISAGNELNLALAQITGPNYLSVRSTNQFDGNAGASIQSPFTDLNLGVTNGFLTVSNLLAPQIPNWSGNIQAWSTRWIAVDANGVTNDFRVLIVGSQVNPTTLAQVQDLILHGTNSIVIGDTFNVIRTFSSDAQNLTLTTNGAAVGATSLDGELNLNSGAIFWQSSLPNLRNLTNNGAIRTLNQASFGNPLVISSKTNTPAAAAAGKLARAGALVVNVNKNDKLVIGTNHYAFVSKLTNAVPNQVKIATTFDGSMNNLIAAINGAAGAGTKYSTATKSNGLVKAGLLAAHAFTVTARTAGTAGNSIATLAVSTNHVTWKGSNTLSGGVDFAAGSTNVVSFPYDNFINSGVVSDQGSIIYAGNFVSSGVLSNGVGSFTLQSLTTTLTNGLLQAGGDVSITASNLVTGSLMLQAGRSLTLRVTNLLTDGVPNGASGLTNGNLWSVQSTNGTGGNGLMLLVKPATGDLLGTTISNYAAGPAKQIINVWAGQDRGVSASGFTNNAAVGRLMLDAIGTASQFKFSGAGTGNALYVDKLVFLDQATNGINNSYDFTPNLSINTNLVIYFAQAEVNGISIAAKIETASLAGRNNGGRTNGVGRLRWVPAYAGHFSSTNMVFPGGITKTFNAAFAASTNIGAGIAKANVTTPVFTSGDVNLTITITNIPPLTVMLQWDSIPGATNYVQYQTNMMGTWFTLTNFVSPSSDGWPITNKLFEAVIPAQQRFYNIKVVPNSTQP